MRILIISQEAWRDEQNGGNVLSNLFANFDAEFAQIYCNEREPNNNICLKYFQITDRDMVGSLKGKGKAGRLLDYQEYPHAKISSVESYSSGRKWLGNYLALAREIVWSLGTWDKDGIIKFVNDFNPDIIFAPYYGRHFMIKLLKLVHSVVKVPVVSYISDDNYTFRQFRFAPSFWINLLLLRKQTRNIFKHYSLCYTMTDEQKEQCETDFGVNMKILRKCGKFEDRHLKETTNNPIRIVYAGGIYLNRWKTLSKIASAIRSINESGIKIVMDIYTNTILSEQMNKAINDGISSTVHNAVSMCELASIYHKSDIALHVEAFDITNRNAVRMSFSTKIVDCLDSGCAVMAVCDKKQAGGAYLRRNNCAICIHDLSLIESELRKIIDDPQILIDYQHKAFEIGRLHHDAKNTENMVYSDFIKLISK